MANQPNSNDDIKSTRSLLVYRIFLIPTLVMFFIGAGSVWRLPYIIYRNGGGAAIVLLALVMILLVAPILCSEISMGSYMKGPIKMFRLVPICQALGATVVFYVVITVPYYTTIGGYSTYYLYASTTNLGEISKCSNHWNTMKCENNHPRNDESFERQEAIRELKTPQEEFYLNYFHKGHLEAQRFQSDLGGMNGKLVLANFVFSLLLVPFFVYSPMSVGLFCLMAFLLCTPILGVLLVRTLTLPGAHEGQRYAFVPNFDKAFGTPLAFKDIFISLTFLFSLGTGVTSTVTHYGRRVAYWGIDVPFVLVFVFSAVLMNTSLVFGLMGFLAYEKGQTVQDTATTGTRLVFVILLEAFGKLPSGHLWAGLFYTYLTVLILTSTVGMLEVINSAIIAVVESVVPSFARSRSQLLRFCVSLGVILANFMVSLIYCTYQGIHILTLVDQYSVILIYFVLAIQLVTLAVYLVMKGTCYWNRSRGSGAGGCCHTMLCRICIVVAAVVVTILGLLMCVFGGIMLWDIFKTYKYDTPILKALPGRWAIGMVPVVLFVILTPVVALCIIVRNMRRSSGRNVLLQLVVPNEKTKDIMFGKTSKEKGQDPHAVPLYPVLTNTKLP